jgi:hypothetical protein
VPTRTSMLDEAVLDEVEDGPRRCWEGLAEGES